MRSCTTPRTGVSSSFDDPYSPSVEKRRDAVEILKSQPRNVSSLYHMGEIPKCFSQYAERNMKRAVRVKRSVFRRSARRSQTGDRPKSEDGRRRKKHKARASDEEARVDVGGGHAPADDGVGGGHTSADDSAGGGLAPAGAPASPK